MMTIGVEELGPKPGRMALAAGDILGYAFQGGGGYGDPIKRDPNAVSADIANGHVTIDAARAQYGVVFNGNGPDQAATKKRREEIRAERLGGAPQRPPGKGDLAIDGGRFACSCGCDLGPASGDWKARARSNVLKPGDLGPHVRTHAELELREHVCRDCGSLLETEVVRKDERSLVSMLLDA